MEWLIIAFLATFRLALLPEEKIFEPVRKFVGFKYDEAGNEIGFPHTFWGYLISCYYCRSVWAGFICAILYYTFPYALMPFALSTGAMVIYEKVLK